MLIKKSPDIQSSEITDNGVYVSRRKFLLAGSASLAALAAGAVPDWPFGAQPAHAGAKLAGV